MWFWKKNKPTKIQIEDLNAKRKEGLVKIFDIFKEVTGNHETYIDKFIQEYQPPDQEILDFVLKYRLTLIENEAPINRYRRAQEFVRLRNKYGFVFTASGYNKFKEIMKKDYRIELEFKSIASLNLNTKIIQMLMEAIGKISLQDTALYGQYRSIRYYHNGKETRKVENGKLLELVGKRKPEGLSYAQPFEITWDDEELKLLQKELNEEPRWVPTKFSYGEFQAIQVDKDPIFIANLKDNMYMTLGHIPALPKVNRSDI